MSLHKPPAELATKALADTFHAIESDFACFTLREEAHPTIAVAYAATSGLDLGEGLRSWREIFDDAHDEEGTFNIQIGDRLYDCRQGMTKAVYERLVVFRQLRSMMSPDSREWAETSGNGWTWTMLTGNCVAYEPLKASAALLTKAGQRNYGPSHAALELVRSGLKVLRETTSMPLISTSSGEVYQTGSNPLTASQAVLFRPAVILDRIE